MARLSGFFLVGRCATVIEIKRLTESLAKQSPSPHLHCFIGKRNVFDCEAILGLLEEGQLSFSFSPSNGPRLNQEEIYHLVAFLEILIHENKTAEVRRKFYREWQRDLLTTGGQTPGVSDVLLESSTDPTSDVPFPDETSVTDRLSTVLGEANFDPNRMPVPPWTTRERLLHEGWFGMAIPTVDEEEEKKLIAHAFAFAKSATPSAQPRPARLLICGWYGTETLGDKAILGGVIIAARKRSPSSCDRCGVAGTIRDQRDVTANARPPDWQGPEFRRSACGNSEGTSLRPSPSSVR